VMAGVAERHAAEVSCPIIMRELFLLPDSRRRLFAGIDRHVTAPEAVRKKLVELYDAMLGVQVTPHSPDVDSAYRIFFGVLEREKSDWFTHNDNGRCSIWDDIYFFDGILDDAVKEYGDESEYWRSYELDWDYVNAFMNSIDFSDPRHAARAWVSVLAYLLMDYRYLYL